MAGSRGQRKSRVGYLGMALLGLAAGQSMAMAADYDFAYRLSGDRRVAPLQVFDDGRSTWLQFHAGQALPAIFATGGGQARLVPFTQQGPYVVLEGTAAGLSLRIGDITAQVEYTGAQPRHGVGGQAPATSPQWQDTVLPAMPPIPVPPGGTAARLSQANVAPAPVPVIAMSPSTPASTHADALVYDAAPADKNMRRVLERWARHAGWSFGPEHWTVDVDIPLVGGAAFGPDFRQAVRGLLGATELGERPLQPCFYANQVLRVVPLAQACDRTSAPQGAAAVQS